MTDNPLADFSRDALHAAIRAWLDHGPMPKASDMLPASPFPSPSAVDFLGAMTAPTVLDAAKKRETGE